MRLIVDLSDILKYYPQGNEDITSIILTSSSMKKLQERLHIKYEYFIENINPSVPILIDKFLQISPEKQILIYPYSIYRDPENCILIDHIDSGVTQVYTNIEDIPETFFHT